jgi:hypothetical protein
MDHPWRTPAIFNVKVENPFVWRNRLRVYHNPDCNWP